MYKDIKLGKLYKSISESSAQNTCVEEINIYTDDAGSKLLRPGLKEYLSDIGDGRIDGLYWFDEKQILLIVAYGEVYSVTDKFGTYTKLTGTGKGKLAKEYPVSFCEGYSSANIYVFMCNKSDIIYTDGTSITVHPALGDVAEATHVCFLNQRLIANRTSSVDPQFNKSVYYTKVGDPLDFVGGGSFEAETLVDSVESIITSNNKMYVFGKNSIDVYQNTTGTFPFGHLSGSTQGMGVYSSKSVIQVDNDIYFFNQRREVYKLTDNGVTRISDPVVSVFSSLSYIEDVILDKITTINGKDFLLLHFPTEKLTWVYDIKLDRWSKWGTWDGISNWNRWIGIHYVFCPKWNLHLIGCSNSSSVYELDYSYFKDASQQIVAEIISGNITHGVTQYKHGKRLFILAETGLGLQDNKDESPKILLQYRDNFTKTWSQIKEIDLGILGQYNERIIIPTGGKYQARQYKIRYASNQKLVLKELIEHIYDVERTG